MHEVLTQNVDSTVWIGGIPDGLSHEERAT